MPTGYTAGIIDGTTKTFEEFATLCMRGFGATIHMRDEPLTKRFEPRQPSEYYAENITRIKNAFAELKTISDADLIADERARLSESKSYHEKAIKEAHSRRATLLKFLSEAKQWEPPTDEHTEFKQFLIQQITETISWDCSTKYHDEKLAEIIPSLSDMNAEKIRIERLKSLEKELAYNEKQYAEDVSRCAKANQWVEQVIESFQTAQ